MHSERTEKVSETIFQATQAILTTLSTSYGPRGLDKMLVEGSKSVVTNDGATILGFYKTHPVHKILSAVSAAQDTNCGDGTTSVILLACCLYDRLYQLLAKGVHPSKIHNALDTAKALALSYIDGLKIPIEEQEFASVALTALNTKIVSKSAKMASVAVEALAGATRDEIRVVKKVGESLDDVQYLNSVLIPAAEAVPAGEYRALLIQFCLSTPKTNMDSKVVIDDPELIDKFVREEKEYVIRLVQRIKDQGASLLLIQKSLLRESCSELAAYFL